MNRIVIIGSILVILFGCNTKKSAPREKSLIQSFYSVDSVIVRNHYESNVIVPHWNGTLLPSEYFSYDCTDSIFSSVRQNLLMNSQLDTLESGLSNSYKLDLSMEQIPPYDRKNLTYAFDFYDASLFETHPYEWASSITEFVTKINRDGSLTPYQVGFLIPRIGSDINILEYPCENQ